jgi:hypothetical protein
MARKHAFAMGVVVLLTASAVGGQSESQSARSVNEQEIAEWRKTLFSDSADLNKLASSVQNQSLEFSTVSGLSQKASAGAAVLDAAYWFFAIYDRMQCNPDREAAKQVLINRLGLYAHLLDLHADHVAGDLGYTRVPAIAQAGSRGKDDLRSAKAKLDEILATLK